jgi:hypothetical protein
VIEESPGHDVPQRPYPKLIFIGPNGLRSGWRFVIFNTLFVGIMFGLLSARRALTPGGFKGNSFTPDVVALQECLFLIGLLLALTVMFRIEKRAPSDWTSCHYAPPSDASSGWALPGD